LPASRRGPVQAAWNEVGFPDASRACDLAAETSNWAVQPARGDGEVSWDDRPPGELSAPLTSCPACPVWAPGGEHSVYRNAHPQGGVAVPAVQVVKKVADGVQARGRRPVWDGPCYRAADRGRQVRRSAGYRRRAFGGAADGAPAVQLAVMITAAIATSWAARFMHSLLAAAVPSGRESACMVLRVLRHPPLVRSVSLIDR